MKKVIPMSVPVLVFVGCVDGMEHSGDTTSTIPGTPREATAEQLAATPRGQPELEALALSMTGGFITDQETYERVVADIGAIRSVAPELNDIHYRHSDDAKTVMLGVGIETLNEMRSGTYTAWAPLNSRYGVLEIEYHEYSALSQQLVLIQTKGTYNISLLADDYAALPKVQSAFPNGIGGDGNDICGIRDGQAMRYLFTRGAGDCPAGCTEGEFYYFKSEASGEPELVGEWGTRMTTPRPGWFQQFTIECN